MPPSSSFLHLASHPSCSPFFLASGLLSETLFGDLALRHHWCLAETWFQTRQLSDVQCEHKYFTRSLLCNVQHRKHRMSMQRPVNHSGSSNDETNPSEVGMKAFQLISQWHLPHKSHKGQNGSLLVLQISAMKVSVTFQSHTIVLYVYPPNLTFVH